MKKIIKLDKIRSFHGGYWRYDFLDFYYLFNHYFPSPAMYKILQKELPMLTDNYPSTQKTIAKSLSKWNNKPYFNEDNLIVGNGSSELIRILNQIITRITIPIPTFNEYVQLPKEKMAALVLKEKDKFKLDIDELIGVIKKTKSDFTVINNPNNPTGNITSRKAIEKLLKTNVMTIIDEAFIDFCPKYSVEDLVEKYKNLIILKSLSKVSGAAGLRIGYLLTTNQEIKDKVRRYLPIWNINSIAERMIELFPKFRQDYKKSIRKTIKDREYLFNKLKQISYLEPYEPRANFIFCQTGISSRKIAETLFAKHNILIKFGLNQKILKSDRYIRIGVKTKKDNNKLISALKDIKFCKNI
jgi:histidinol-phosphate/aromatic aminotransferase/cobyric acid decarboxylase-like protein